MNVKAFGNAALYRCLNRRRTDIKTDRWNDTIRQQNLNAQSMDCMIFYFYVTRYWGAHGT